MLLSQISLAITRIWSGLGSGAFSPLDLFKQGEQGAWYDPSDFSTMFQESVGTTPVTAVGQPVGLILDKSKGLALGSELVTNGDFSVDSGWTKGVGTTISGGKANFSASAGYVLYNTAVAGIVAGGYYEVTYTISGYVSGTIRPYIGASASFGPSASANGTYSVRFGSISTAEVGFNSPDAFTGSIDNFSVKAVLGNHAIQATAAARPVLSARLNLLTYTEDLSNNYGNPRATVAINVINSPTSTLTADKLIEDSTASSTHYVRKTNTIPNGSAVTLSGYFKAGERTWVVLSNNTTGGPGAYFDLVNGVVGSSIGTITSKTITNVGNGWYRCSVSFVSSDVYFDCLLAIGDGGISYTGDGTSGLYVWGLQAEGGPVMTRYQWVTTPANYDAVGFPYYLEYDGVDDFLKSLVFSSNITTPTNTFGIALTAHSGSKYVYDGATLDSMELYQNGASGMVSMYAGGISSTTVGPLTLSTPFVLTNQFNQANGKLRLNGVGGTVTTGSVSTNALTLFSNSNGVAPSAGRIYAFICRDALSTAQEIIDTETWVNGKTGAY